MTLFQRLCFILCISFGFSINAIAGSNGVMSSSDTLQACAGKPLVIGDVCAISANYLNYCDYTKQIVPITNCSSSTGPRCPFEGLYACVIGKNHP